MGKKILLQFARGYAISVAVCALIQLCVAQWAGHTVTPGFARHFANEAAAALAQLCLTGLIGASFSCGALAFEIENWSFLRQGALHFLVTAVVWVPVVWICWMPITGLGLLISIAGWLFTYGVNWLIAYFLNRRQVLALNRRIRRYREEMQ